MDISIYHACARRKWPVTCDRILRKDQKYYTYDRFSPFNENIPLLKHFKINFKMSYYISFQVNQLHTQEKKNIFMKMYCKFSAKCINPVKASDLLWEYRENNTCKKIFDVNKNLRRFVSYVLKYK